MIEVKARDNNSAARQIERKFRDERTDILVRSQNISSFVMKACFQVGLYRQGLLHDPSKYGWTEFRVGCRYYQGTRSPNNAEREEKGVFFCLAAS